MRNLLVIARDIVWAYLGGLVIGAPLGLLMRWMTGVDFALTATIVLAILLIFSTRVFAHSRSDTPQSPPRDES